MADQKYDKEFFVKTRDLLKKEGSSHNFVLGYYNDKKTLPGFLVGRDGPALLKKKMKEMPYAGRNAPKGKVKWKPKLIGKAVREGDTIVLKAPRKLTEEAADARLKRCYMNMGATKWWKEVKFGELSKEEIEELGSDHLDELADSPLEELSAVEKEQLASEPEEFEDEGIGLEDEGDNLAAVGTAPVPEDEGYVDAEAADAEQVTVPTGMEPSRSQEEIFTLLLALGTDEARGHPNVYDPDAISPEGLRGLIQKNWPKPTDEDPDQTVEQLIARARELMKRPVGLESLLGLRKLGADAEPIMAMKSLWQQAKEAAPALVSNLVAAGDAWCKETYGYTVESFPGGKKGSWSMVRDAFDPSQYDQGALSAKLAGIGGTVGKMRDTAIAAAESAIGSCLSYLDNTKLVTDIDNNPFDVSAPGHTLRSALASVRDGLARLRAGGSERAA